MTRADYEAFLAAKLACAPPTGLATVPPLASHLFPHQRDLVAWALRRGRAAIFASTGLGKTAMFLEWARHVAGQTSRPVLVLAPLAVARQTADEGAKFGADVTVCRDGADVRGGINVTNYERLHRFDAAAFGGVVCDESGILKSQDGKTRATLTAAFAGASFKLCATATPAPNDWTELGQHAEFLGVCTRAEMLAEFFVHDGGSTQDWRLKGHARAAFWRWVASWGALVRHPRDLGHNTAGYDLPPLDVREHIVDAGDEVARDAGLLFAMPASALAEQRAAKRASLGARVAKAADLIAAAPGERWLVFCELNDEADALERAVPGAVQVAGADDLDTKEARLLAFARGETRVLVTKCRIASHGLNLQSVARVLFVGPTHSYEQFFQATRRCHRFGQTRPVVAHVVCGAMETEVLANLKRKELEFEAMGAALAGEVAAVVRAAVRGGARLANDYRPTTPLRVPSWLRTEAT